MCHEWQQLLSLDKFQFVDGLLPLVHQVVKLLLKGVVCLIILFVILCSGCELTVVLGYLSLYLGGLRLNGFNGLAVLTDEFFLLLLLFLAHFSL